MRTGLFVEPLPCVLDAHNRSPQFDPFLPVFWLSSVIAAELPFDATCRGEQLFHRVQEVGEFLLWSHFLPLPHDWCWRRNGNSQGVITPLAVF